MISLHPRMSDLVMTNSLGQAVYSCGLLLINKRANVKREIKNMKSADK